MRHTVTIRSTSSSSHRAAGPKQRIARMLDRHGVPTAVKQQCLRILDQMDERKARLLEAKLKDFF